jgi:two-component sensor histidine kinase
MGQEKELSPRDILNETINRVLSIATVHEILSEAVLDEVDVLDLIKRVSVTISSNMVSPTANITISVQGDALQLPSQKATSLALVANELLQNALEHGMVGQAGGKISVTLAYKHKQLHLTVADNGRGLPPGFDSAADLGLGLDIVKASVEEDMRGSFHIGPAKVGTIVKIIVPI